MIPVVIGTNPERRNWLKDSIKSIRATSTRRRVFVHRTGGYEIAALRAGIQKYPRFLFLHDSCEVLDPAFWETVDHAPDSWLYGAPHMYLGIFTSTNLEHALHDVPYEMDKSSSIHWENELGMRLQLPTLWPEVVDQNGQYGERHGRMNLVLGNDLARKWKGNWGQV